MKKVLLFLHFALYFLATTAQNNVGIGTTNPKAQLHTTGTVRHEVLKGTGIRQVYANDSGNLVTKQVNSSNTGFNIPDATCTGASSPITVSGLPNAIASSLIQVNVNISHTSDNNLTIYLISPTGQILMLANQNGGSGANFYNTFFADNATTTIAAGAAPFTGTYKPVGDMSSICLNTTLTSFAAFGGGSIVPNGTWTLKVADVTAGNTGILNNWSISFDGSEPAAASIPPNYVPKANSNGILVKGTMYDNGNIGIGTSSPSEKLSIGGNLLVKQPVIKSQGQPDAGHTVSLASHSIDSLIITDSVYRILDPGGTSNYPAGDTAAFLLIDTTGTTTGDIGGGLEVTFDSIMMANGDSLYVLIGNNFIALRGGSNLNGTHPVFSGNNIYVYYGSLLNSPTAPGFSAVVRKLYVDKNAAGEGGLAATSSTSLFFNSLNGSFKAGISNTGSLGKGAFAIGSNCNAQGQNSGALGANSNATGNGDIGIGGGNATGGNSLAIGLNAYTLGSGSIAFTQSRAEGLNSFALAGGYTIGNGSTAIGALSRSYGSNSIAINGAYTQPSASNSLAAGANANAQNTDAIALGNEAHALGTGSVALGYHNTASGNYSASLGYASYATGLGSVALGTSSAGGNYATSMGSSSAYGTYATAMGEGSSAGGEAAVAGGNSSYASGIAAISLGNSASASANYAVAIGNNVAASGIGSTALGNYCTTSSHSGSFVIGDNSTTTVMQTFVNNEMRARFAGGIRFYTTSAVTIGAYLNQGANSWAALSDKRMKENFLPVNGEVFLKKIAAMPLTTWNYIGQDVKVFRHYGPMAQDFFAAFGKDDLGAIGCDTLINQQDFLGVSLVAIQALEKRTQNLQTQNEALKTQNEQMRLKNEQLEARLQKLEAALFKN